MEISFKKNARIPSSVFLVSIWKDIKKLKMHSCHPEGHRCNFFYYIYIISDEH
jgi:hypothetical protein